MSNLPKPKQIALQNQHIVVGGADGRGTNLPPGSDGQYLQIISGSVVYGPAPAGVVYLRKNFSEVGPATPAAGSHTLTTTLPDTLQGGSKDSLNITINGLAIDLDEVTLAGAGPFTVSLNMANIGYSIDSGDKVFVSYSAS